MDKRKTRCWAEISLDNIEHNYRALKARLPEGCRFLGVVKANAYGHGAVKVAKRLEAAGADYLAVACLEEAVELRDGGTRLPILILGHTPGCFTKELIELDITQTVHDLSSAVAYSREAALLGRPLRCHLKLDTGMGRLGFSAERDKADMLSALKLPWLDFEGAYTHYPVSDEGDEEYTKNQYRLFCNATAELEAETGRLLKIKHCANSGAMIYFPYLCGDMARPGILLYGHYPCKTTGGIDVRPCMSLKTRVAQIKTLRTGESVSYGRKWTAERDSVIAVLSIGYADGLFRTLSGRAEVMLRGKLVPLIGNICMDMVMADITDVENAKVGDEALVFGEGLPLEKLTETAGTIPYELLCAVSERVPRIY